MAEDATLRIERRAYRLSVTGDISSAAHEVMLRQAAINLFPDDDHDIDVTVGMATPPGWALVTELTLRAIAETHTATGIIGTDRVDVRGITKDFASWQQAAVRIEENLLPDMKFAAEVVEIRPTNSIQNQCSSLFSSAFRGQVIGFTFNSDHVKSNAYSLLDELVQISADCPGAIIAVTGHTDKTGKEADNKRLSEARARSVVAYMVSRGLAADRLRARGAGSTEPLLDEDSGRARLLNRRVQIELSYP